MCFEAPQDRSDRFYMNMMEKGKGKLFGTWASHSRS